MRTAHMAALDVREFCGDTEDAAILAAINVGHYGGRFGDHGFIESIDDTLIYASFDTYGVVNGLATVTLSGHISRRLAEGNQLMLKSSEALDGTPEGETVRQNLYAAVEQVTSGTGVDSLYVIADEDHADFFLENGFEKNEIEARNYFGVEFWILSKKFDAASHISEQS